MAFKFAVAALLTAALMGRAEAARPNLPDTVPFRGVVDHYTIKDRLQIALVNQKLDLVMDPAKVPDIAAVRAALDASAHNNQEIALDVGADSGSFGSDGMPTYVVRDVVLNGRKVPGDNFGGRVSTQAKTDTEVLSGIAYARSATFQRSLSLLNAALNDSSIGSNSKIWALKYRVVVESYQATGTLPAGDARDRILLASLADAKAWEVLAPDDSDAAIKEADALQYLGAFDEALDVNMRRYHRWPNDHFWTLIDRGLIYRSMGQLSQALDVSDEIVAEESGELGMAYHYHRGWTLSEMGRFDEAVEEFTEGLATQSDYSWAYTRRGCALAALGRLPEALADAQKALGYFEAGNDLDPSALGTLQDHERLKYAVAVLSTAVHSRSHAPISDLCANYWDWGFSGRTRSRLFPSSP